MTIEAIAIIFNNKEELLIVKKGEHWMLPGGELAPGEDESSCLEKRLEKRLSEELGVGVTINSYYDYFTGISPHPSDIIIARVYAASLKDNLGRTSSAIEGRAWLTYGTRRNYNLSGITKKVVENLKREDAYWVGQA